MLKVFLLIYFVLITVCSLCSQVSITTTPNIETTFIEAELEKYLSNSDRQEEKLMECVELDRRNAELQYQLARLYHDKGDYRKALEYGDKAVSLNQSNKWYHLIVADINELLMDYSAANVSLSKVASIEPSNSVIKRRIAQNYELNGNVSESIQTLVQMQKTFGVSEQITIKLLNLYNKNKDYSKGLAILQEAVDITPKNVDMLNALANQYLLMSKEKDAEKVYRKVIEIQPDNITANSHIVRYNAGKSKDSEYLYAIKPLIENPDLPLDAKVIELIPYVEQLQTDQNPELKSALQLITEQLAIQYPDEAKAHSIKGDVMYLTGELSPALKSYDKTLNLNDEVFAVWAQKMNVLYDLQNTSELIKFSEKAIDYYPNQFEGYFWYALGHYDSDDIEVANSYIEEMSLVSGGNLIAKKWSELLITLISSCEVDLVEIVIEDYQLDKSMDPLELHLVSRLYDKAGNSSKAESYATRAMKYGYAGK